MENELDQQDLVSIVAHDLRNPLTCIEGYAAMLLRADMDPAEREKCVRRILSCSRFAEAIVEDLTDAAAVETGELPLDKTQLLASDVLGKAVEEFRLLAEQKGVELTFWAGSPRMVLADAKRLRQVLGNLLSNALKHVDAKTGRVAVILHAVGGELIVEVADNGWGIEPRHLDRIFDKFYQVKDERRGSLGLGLFIARRIVEGHGGRLWARSEGLGKGAKFYFSLPVFDPEKAYNGYKAWRGERTPLLRKISDA